MTPSLFVRDGAGNRSRSKEFQKIFRILVISTLPLMVAEFQIMFWDAVDHRLAFKIVVFAQGGLATLGLYRFLNK